MQSTATVPSEDESVQREGDRHVAAASDDGAVFTHYGRQVKKTSFLCNVRRLQH